MDARHPEPLMPVLVDTNIILDVLTDDPRWADWSIHQLETHAQSGLIINPIIYTELCFGSPSAEFVDDIVRRFGLTWQDIPRQALFRAAQAFARYRKRQGTKTSVLPDFLIGGHAEATHLPLLTRDTKRLKTYFPSVHLITPTTS
jgi:predicted nucleic acid-binding protein